MESGAPLPRVSVIIPTYNRSAMVCGAIDSVLEQTLPDFELLVVDDGSTDDTAAVIEERYGDEPRLSYLRKENDGPAEARAHGLNHARADLLALLDSDDRYLPRFLESQVALMDARPDIDLALCDARYEGDWEIEWETVFSGPHWIAPDSLDAMAQMAFGLPSATMLRAAAARQVGFPSEFAWAEDTDFLWRFHLAGLRLAVNPEVLTSWRRHAGQEGAAQRIDSKFDCEEDRMRLLEIYGAQLPQARDILCHVHRRRAEYLVGRGERRLARRHYWKWWRAKPDSSKALWGVLRNVIPWGRA